MIAIRAALALMVIGLPLAALDPGKTLTQYAHRIWGQEEGLLQPTIYSILQSRDGYMWLGTQDSLIRFDGIHFREYDSAAAAGLQRTLIRAMAEDQDGNLWVASLGDGVVRISPDGGFRRFTEREGLPSFDAFCVAPAADGSTWVCTSHGLARIDRNFSIHVYTTADGLTSNQIRDTCLAKDGTRWVAGLDFGLNSGLNQVSGTRFGAGPSLHNANATSLECAKDGSVWAGTAAGALKIDGATQHWFTTQNGLPDNEVSALLEGPDGAIWIGTNEGITRIKNGEADVYRTSDGLSHSLVLSLLVDREGSLWAGTKDGLDQFTDGKVTPYAVNESGPVVEDEDGHLWVGTLGHGLSSFDGKAFRSLTTQDGLLDNTILSLQVDPGGDLWVGSKRGLNRLHKGKVIAAYTRGNGLSGDSVNALTIDAEGVLWVGTDRGLDRMQDGRFFPSGIKASKGVVALGAGRSIRLFASIDPASFSYLTNDGKATTYALDVGHPVDCYYIEPDKREAWMGTLGSGLLRWKNGVVTHLRVKDGLFDNRIYSILRDDAGKLWMASSKGIFSLSEKELDDFSDGKIRYLSSIPFSTGQLRFECRSGVQPAACRTRDGRLWFSTTNGLVVLDPKKLNGNSIPPPAQITSFVVNGRRVLPSPGMHLSPSERNLEVRYAGLSFVSPEKVSFRYMLDGYDKTWTEAGSRREAFFTNLPPGHFRFRVMARNADGVWSTSDTSITFVADPRFYQHVWFFPLLAFLLAGVVALLVRLRILRMKQRFDVVLAERSRIARELHDTLLQGLSGITMQLQALWTKLPLSKERNMLGEIIKDAADCSAEARRSLWGLRNTGGESNGFSDKLTKLVRDAVKESNLQLSFKVNPVSAPATPETEYQLLRIAQEAVTNVLKHAKARKLEVELRSSAGLLELLLSDDGTGFEPQRKQLGHFGITGMRERAEEIGATLEIDSLPGRGTALRVLLAKGIK